MGAIGTNVPRLDATEKAAGRATYTVDLRLPGLLHGRFLRSPHPHARLLHVDAERARRLPGVRAVVTGADAPAVRHGRVIKDETAFPTTRVRFVGERVAAVAAIDPDIAEEAVGLIRVEYEPLPPVHTPEEAMREGAPVLHEELASYVSEVKAERFGNVCARFLTVQGAGADGFAEADLVVEDSFTTHIAHQAYIEPHCVLAACEPSGRATVWTNAQSPFDVRRVLAEVTGLPESQIRVVVPPIGGAFGGKLYLMDEPQALLLALRAGKPVKLQMTYEDEFLAGYPRHPSTIHLRTGVKANGELVAREARIIVDSGAYAGYGPNTTLQIARWVIGPYRVPHTRVEASCVYTNKMNCGFYRGPGHTQAVFACETQIDRVATELGQDPVEFRLRNLEENGPGAPDFRAILRRAAESWGWGKPLPRRTLGRGIAVSHRGSGGRPASAWVRLNNDGTATMYTGTVDLTGSNVALAQVVAEELGLPTHRVAVVSGDTDATPFDSGTNASRVTFVTGG
ncbi:MAG: xanthine dehydrogenase family protein molybdopterin-binding subunit, partial [Deltaproteobacteria bacterium]|nr:xanthine dehydrogenase family protein molybdopterin-binding subunit [Deltaproteobacteria bacterium]